VICCSIGVAAAVEAIHAEGRASSIMCVQLASAHRGCVGLSKPKIQGDEREEERVNTMPRSHWSSYYHN